ncbi:PREDICTED: uncharacterized protein LOC108372094 [Rhagoletis zephyria]|uniref:uncharacterized protein LOC108372094 n=1 Tax=Rhagoletis zephyria TaxID=28612 RepID=UPI0008113CB7|nr:PREDICTED: uncharacterized protein LOC108372094 [Rhagoletis zephyria]
MKAIDVYSAVICAFVHYANAQDATSVDCTKPPRYVPLHMCCPVPSLTTDELMQQCAKFAGPPQPPPMTRSNNVPPPRPRGGPKMRGRTHPHGLHAPPCLMECIFNQTGVIGEDGELHEDKFMELLNTVVRDNDEMMTVMEESFATCFEKATDIKAKIADKMKEDPKFAQRITKPKFRACSPFSARIMTCINFKTFQNCPTSAWNDSEECNAFRKFVMEC